MEGREYMKKWIAWFLMIPICIVALRYLYSYIMFTPLDIDMEPTALLFFVSIFYLICLCNVIVHLYALITGIIQRANTTFLRLTSFTKKGILKWIGLVLIIFYSHDLFVTFKTNNTDGIVWNILAIIVTIFYVSWFNTFKSKDTSVKKEVVLG